MLKSSDLHILHVVITRKLQVPMRIFFIKKPCQHTNFIGRVSVRRMILPRCTTAVVFQMFQLRRIVRKEFRNWADNINIQQNPTILLHRNLICVCTKRKTASHMSAHQRKSHNLMWSNTSPYTLTTIQDQFQILINCHWLGKSLSYHFRSRNDWVTGTWSGIRQDFEWIRCNVEFWTSHRFGAWVKFIMVAFPSHLRHARSENLVSRDWWTICTFAPTGSQYLWNLMWSC